MADHLQPPPPYEDVWRNASYGATSTTPTAPPFEATWYEQPTYHPPAYSPSSLLYAAYPSSPASTSPAPPTAPPTRDQRGIVERYVSYSIPSRLYCPGYEDGSPGDSRTTKSCCVSSCLCCFGAVLVLGFVALPLAMIIAAGLRSYNICTSSNTSFSRLLRLYFYVGGGLLALLVCLRTCASIFTCCRNGRRHHHTPGYYLGTKVFICTFEVFVVLCVVANLVLLGGASYFMVGDLIDGRYCNKNNYTTVSYIFAQYLIYMLSCLFCCLSYCCI